MSVQVTPGFMRKFTEMEKDIVKPQILDTVEDMANYAVNNSPVWSGAYVNSWSIKANNTSSRGRRRVSTITRGNENAERESARSNLFTDISRIEVMEEPLRSITMRNDSAHAQAVEATYPVASGLRGFTF